MGFFFTQKNYTQIKCQTNKKNDDAFFACLFHTSISSNEWQKTSTDFARFPFRFCIVVSLMSACLILVCYLSKSFFSFQFEIINALLLHLLENHLARDFVQWFTYTSQVKIAHLMLKFWWIPFSRRGFIFCIQIYVCLLFYKYNVARKSIYILQCGLNIKSLGLISREEKECGIPSIFNFRAHLLRKPIWKKKKV